MSKQSKTPPTPVSMQLIDVESVMFSLRFLFYTKYFKKSNGILRLDQCLSSLIF